MDDMLKARLERAATMQGRYLELATKLGRPPTEDELNFFDHNGGHVFNNEVEEIEDSYRRDAEDWMHGKPLPPRSIKRSASFSPEIRSRVENIAKSNDIKKFWPFKRRKELTPEEAEMALIRFDMATGMSDDDSGWKDYLERHPTLKRDIEAADARRKAKKEETSSKKASASFSPETRSRILKSANRERILRVCSTIRKGDYTQEEKENPDNFGPVTEPAPKTNVHGDTGKAKLKFTQGYTSRKIIPEDVAAIDLGAEMSAASDKKAQETNDKYKAYLDKHPGLAKQEVETPRTKKIKEYLKSQEFIDHLNGKEGIFMMDGVWYNPFEDKEYSQREINNKAVELWEKIVNDMKINPLKYAESDTSMFKED